MKRLVSSFVLVAAVVTGLSVGAPSAHASQCFQQYDKDVQDCANLQTWTDRSLCGLDAAANLAGCVRRTVMG